MTGPSTLVDVLEVQAETDGDATAYTFRPDGAAFHPARTSAVVSVTYAELRDRAAGIAREVGDRIEPGQPVVLVYPTGLEAVAALLGCMYAGCIPVPTSYLERDVTAWREQLDRLSRHAGTSHVLMAESIRARLGEYVPSRCEVLAAETVPGHDGGPLHRGVASAPAFLQFTSGSTGDPKGVVVSHENVISYSSLVQGCLDDRGIRGPYANWMPYFHDGGMMAGVLQPLCSGVPSHLLAPESFLARPIRWLRTISQTGAVVAGSPSFGYELCVRRTSPEEREGLDLSSWEIAANAAEPIQADTLDRFTEAFEPHGFAHTSHTPAYGLAEATVLATFDLRADAPDRPVTLDVDLTALSEGHVSPAEPGIEQAVRLVGCGPPLPSVEVAIIDGVTGKRQPDGTVGEICVRGPTIAAGYWRDEATTAARFGQVVVGEGPEPFLHTGDLGLLHDGQLFPTGRVDDVIIVRGRNVYPQDVERVAEGAHHALRRGRSVAFTLPQVTDTFGLVVELASAGTDHADIIRAVRTSVGRTFGIPPSYIALVEGGTVPRTPSGKVRRGTARQLVATGDLEVVVSWPALGEPDQRVR